MGPGKPAVLYSESCWRPCEDEKCMSVVKTPAPWGVLKLRTTRKRLTNAAVRERWAPCSPPLSLSNRSFLKMIYFLINVPWQVWFNGANYLCQLEGPKERFVLAVINAAFKKHKSREALKRMHLNDHFRFMIFFLSLGMSHGHAYKIERCILLLLHLAEFAR